MRKTKVGVAGFGAIGRSIVSHIGQGIEGIELSVVGIRNPDSPPEFDWGDQAPPRFTTLDNMEPYCDIVIECAPASQLPVIAKPFLKAGKRVVTLSSSALLLQPELIELARQHHGQLLVPSGAILGLDAILAAAEGTVESVKMISRKPLQGFEGAPYLEK